MKSLYLIAVKTNRGKHTALLTWTAASNAKKAWSILAREWREFLESSSRADRIKELKRKEGAHMVAVKIDCDSVQ